ncbi:manganese/zinc/iron transport system permease protein [Amycolatopsis arida]|uniref:Manganese/zinc/iron transport system permease protein n=1 Tax=Amycolatopsis arida TaxID=587909 RepID=A0A1I6A5Y3_9PSEU|nr:metal ABC transporter permease [Amycolatopsis arida]TDX88586.1 manganese/zinc/iron transport system permease protein [Amycolatopsis arida]SFQ64156.1 manganese/zinc/iron transport system permease protein [Amycolatopsis arida]
MSADDVWIVLIGGLLATACGVLGSFLVLRRQALLPDAVSHAVLPGIVLIFLLSGQRSTPLTILGATAFGVLCVLGFEWLRRTGVVASDAALALIFPALFSLGVLGIGEFASGVHLDLDAAIYGEITFAPLRTVFDTPVPKSLVTTGAAAVLAVLFVVLFWRPLQASSFDPEFAELSGLRGRAVGRALLVVVAGLAVVAFDSVGAILVVTFFVVPAVTAQLLTRRLSSMLVVAVAVGWVSAFAGQRAAVALDTSVAGAIGLAAVACFALALLSTRRRRPLRGS